MEDSLPLVAEMLRLRVSCLTTSKKVDFPLPTYFIER